MTKIKPKDRLDKVISQITELVDKVEKLGFETEFLRNERDGYLKQAILQNQINIKVISYHKKMREVMKKFITHNSPLDRELKKIKPPKLK